MTRILLTGASGFIGRTLLPALQKAGHEAVPFTGRITNPDDWSTQPQSEVVIHLAARSYVPESWNDPTGFLDVNVTGTQRAIDYCRHHKARLIMASTYLYGRPDHLPVRETDPLRPTNPYSLSKLMAEHLFRFAADQKQIDGVILRLFNVYGTGQRQEFLVPSILRQIFQNETIEVADLDPRRDYIHVRDVARAFVLSVNAPPGLHCLNICSGQSVSVAELIGFIQQAAHTDRPITSRNSRRPGEIMDVVGDNSAAHNLLGWRPECSLVEGLENLVNSIRAAA